MYTTGNQKRRAAGLLRGNSPSTRNFSGEERVQSQKSPPSELHRIHLNRQSFFSVNTVYRALTSWVYGDPYVTRLTSGWDFQFLSYLDFVGVAELIAVGVVDLRILRRVAVKLLGDFGESVPRFNRICLQASTCGGP